MIKREYFVSYIMYDDGLTSCGSTILTVKSWFPIHAKELSEYAEGHAARKVLETGGIALLSISKIRTFLW